MELKDVLAKLSDEEQGVVNAAIESEKTKGIEASRKKGVENNRLLGILGKAKEHYVALGLDPDAEDLDSRVNKLVDTLTSKGGKETENLTLTKRIERLEADLGKERKEKEEAQSRFRRSRIAEDLGKRLKGIVIGDDIVVDHIISKGLVKINDSDRTVWIRDGEEIEIDEGVNEYLKARPDLLVNKQASGSGSSQGGKKPPKKTMPLSQFKNLSGKERSEYMKTGGEVTDN